MSDTSKFIIYSVNEDDSLTRDGELQNYTSVQWLSIYDDVGEVQIICNVTDDNWKYLIENNVIYNPEDETAAIIKKVVLNESEAKPTLTVRGLLSMSRWGDRVVMGTHNIRNVEPDMLNLAESNRRGLSGETAPATGLVETTETQTSWGTVLESFQDICPVSGLGYKERFDTGAKSYVLEMYKGVDRTRGSEHYNGFFGDEIGNLESAAITWDSAEYKNVAVVAGEGEGANRVVVTVSLGAQTGDKRREMFVDARDISRTYQIATNTGTTDSSGNPVFEYSEATYTDTEYKALLVSRGLQKLFEQIRTIEVKAEVINIEGSTLEFGVDYNLGDIVPLKLKNRGLSITARVSKVTRIYEQGGKRLRIGLSDFILIQEATK